MLFRSAARTSGDDKVAALRNFGWAKGSCFKCGERWGREHTCPHTMQLHIVEELLALFTQDEMTSSDNPDSGSEETKTTCSISFNAMNGAAPEVSGVIQLQAFITNHEVLILIDSCSSTSFITQQLALQLPGIKPLPKSCRVHVADGSQHSCSSYIPAVSGHRKDINSPPI